MLLLLLLLVEEHLLLIVVYYCRLLFPGFTFLMVIAFKNVHRKTS